jgi:hypothetical protein
VVTVPSERPASDGNGRYRVDTRCLPFTPSWFWEVVDTTRGSIVENSLALSRTVYRSPTEALAAGHAYALGRGLRPPADGRRPPDRAFF